MAFTKPTCSDQRREGPVNDRYSARAITANARTNPVPTNSPGSPSHSHQASESSGISASRTTARPIHSQPANPQATCVERMVSPQVAWNAKVSNRQTRTSCPTDQSRRRACRAPFAAALPDRGIRGGFEDSQNLHWVGVLEFDPDRAREFREAGSKVYNEA